MTVKKFMEFMKNETPATAFTIICLGEEETFQKEEINKMIRIWGLEEVDNYYMLNTKEMWINIK